MSLAAQHRALASAGAAMRRETFAEGKSGRMADTDGALPFNCYWSADKSGELSFALGFKETHDFILRVDKDEANFDPTIGKSVRLTDSEDREYLTKLATRADSDVNPEHVFGCKADF